MCRYLAAPTRPATRQCTDAEFTCDDGTCIELSQRCDRQYHCPDGTDEFHCGKSTHSAPLIPPGVNLTLRLSIQCVIFIILIADMRSELNYHNGMNRLESSECVEFIRTVTFSPLLNWTKRTYYPCIVVWCIFLISKRINTSLYNIVISSLQCLWRAKITRVVTFCITN